LDPGSAQAAEWALPRLARESFARRKRESFDSGFQTVTIPDVMRTVLVGDVHGCLAELDSLLDQIAFAIDDRLVFLGDLVARGPDSAGVLEVYRRSRATGVQGNHEQRLLEAKQARVEGKRGPRLGPAHYRLLRELDDADWDLLEALPLFVDLPEHGVRVVHAGVQPAIAFEDQDPWTLTHIRSVTSEGSASERMGGTPWAALYDQGPHIVFGHNSRLELQLEANATGLDTACVYGGTLSCLVLEANQQVPTDPAERATLIHSVPARKRYYAGIGAPETLLRFG
jgi:Calcineurin-like phosphoesterase